MHFQVPGFRISLETQNEENIPTGLGRATSPAQQCNPQPPVQQRLSVLCDGLETTTYLQVLL